MQYATMAWKQKEEAITYCQSQEAIIEMLRAVCGSLPSARKKYKMDLKNSKSEQFDTQAHLESMSKSVTALETEVETLEAGMENIKFATSEVISQWWVLAEAGSNFTGYLHGKVPDRLLALDLTVGNALK